ncbi:hypothetical protein AAFF_G00385550 [Aldrovandia affinis]|uniref:Secreted protein n=1 Tax=Aldrovandia affinis TaxID=143900 RepID=A0AAD7WMC4_9TELE|nr:hypothetical protein AAFF_G00385550 [Aldrovandia affinis]
MISGSETAACLVLLHILFERALEVADGFGLHFDSFGRIQVARGTQRELDSDAVVVPLALGRWRGAPLVPPRPFVCRAL